MLARYINGNLDYTSSNNVINYFEGWNEIPTTLPIMNNKEYVVYAFEFTEEGYKRIFILNESGAIYPNAYPLDFFEITDERISRYWNFDKNFAEIIKNKTFPKIYTFKEWRENEYFHGEMFENIGNANSIFKEYEAFMSLEFKSKNYCSAYKIDDENFLCVFCDSSIIAENDFEVVKCPNCLRLQNK